MPGGSVTDRAYEPPFIAVWGETWAKRAPRRCGPELADIYLKNASGRRRGQPTWPIGRELLRLRLVSPGPDAVRRWGGVDAPPRVGDRPRVPGRGETRRDSCWREGRRPGGAPHAGPMMSSGPADPRWTSKARLAPERGRCPEVEDWRRETRGRGERDAPDARDTDERRWAVGKGPHPAATRAR
ncbi:hypothetical protein NDU88_005876 [Pleurodeles waltl]|uniref:Uncharacterized protein n=1 Tax=Pleurodeles waltl TaxID=8319 RepID=A0AAV7VP63_PLEWA|nr:hypothetical protein NDU88_005876 [Pleurodeles waltl]